MRYTLDNDNQLKQVLVAKLPDGSKVIHPSDEMIDALKAGYKLVNTRAPEYDAKTQNISFTYAIKRGKIVKVWEVIDTPEPTGD